ncbi:hypothetical protein, partial [Pseudoduganella umbonata]|uniref:hypothetical protein n=1 Tax=Pseudoduganella umbonata TaxID=864828 RepID=UPI001C873EED
IMRRFVHLVNPSVCIAMLRQRFKLPCRAVSFARLRCDRDGTIANGELLRKVSDAIFIGKV